MGGTLPPAPLVAISGGCTVCLDIDVHSLSRGIDDHPPASL